MLVDSIKKREGIMHRLFRLLFGHVVGEVFGSDGAIRPFLTRSLLLKLLACIANPADPGSVTIFEDMSCRFVSHVFLGASY